MNQNAWDQGKAGFFGAVTAALISVGGMWYFDDDKSVIEVQSEQISSLQTEVGTLKSDVGEANDKVTVLAADNSALEAQLAAEKQRLDAALAVGQTCDVVRTEFDEAETLWQTERLEWQTEKAQLQTIAQDANTRLDLAEKDRDRAMNALENTQSQLEALRFRLDRSMDMKNNHDAVLEILLRLQSKSDDISNESSSEALAAFEREVRDSLGRIDAFRQDYSELERFFNDDMEDYYNRLLERERNGEAPVEGDVMKRRLQELVDGYYDRDKQFDAQWQRLLLRQSALQPTF